MQSVMVVTNGSELPDIFGVQLTWSDNVVKFSEDFDGDVSIF